MTKIIAVIHYESLEQAVRNADIAFEAGVLGVFLIHMEGKDARLLPAAVKIKEAWPDKLVGINYLSLSPAQAISSNIYNKIDMTWTDHQLTHSLEAPWNEASIVQEMNRANPNHLLFTGVAFKHQAPEPDPEIAVTKASLMGFIPTTSGPATGVEAEVDKIAKMREALGPLAPLGIASGITPKNAHKFIPFVSYVLVSTGISSSFYEFDKDKIAELQAICSRES